jgi:hypothetical protein
MKPAFALRLATLSLLVGLGGCGGHGKAFRFARAQFSKHQENFLAAARQAAACTGVGTLTIFYDGSMPQSRDPRGAPTCPDAAAIAANLKAAHARMAYITSDPPYGAERGGMGVVFVMTSRDDFQQTEGAAIYYFVQSQQHPRQYTPLAGGGGHWFLRVFSDMAVRVF